MLSRTVTAAWLCLAAFPATADTGAAVAIATCDSLAANPDDVDRPPGVKGVKTDDMDAQTATLVCRSASRFVETGAVIGPRAAVDGRRVHYQLGRALGLTDDSAEARSWLEKAAAAGSVEAMYALGELFLNAATTSDKAANDAAARGWYEKAAAGGKADAWVAIGALYESGRGVAKDVDAARAWYQKAVAAGSSAGMLALGDMYLYGRGVAQSDAAAKAWFEKAVAIDPEAAIVVALNYVSREDIVAAVPFMEKAAAAGSLSAMYSLGRWYAQGRPQLPQDYFAARGWFEKAAALGAVEAMVWLGDFYANGQGVAKNVASARAWYEKAVAQGSEDAKTKLAALPR